MSDPLASLRGRIGGLALAAQRNPREYTAAARAASPGCQGYWEKRIDPDGALTPSERARRAAAAKKLHFVQLAYSSVKSRRRKRSQ